MARTRRYKKIEKTFVSRVTATVKNWFSKIGALVVKFLKICDSKLTIMIVPHSQSKVVNFQTNVFALCLGIVLIVGIISSFVYFNRQVAGSNAEITRLINENRQTLASLDELRDENNNLLQTAKRFQSSLSQSLSLLGINSSSSVSKASMNERSIKPPINVL